MVKATLQVEGSCLHWKGFTWNNIDVIPSFSWNNIVVIVSSGLVFGLDHFPMQVILCRAGILAKIADWGID